MLQIPFPKLQNRYFAMRHGHSLANAAGIILSNPDRGLPAYGLSGRGLHEVDSALDQNTVLGAATRIVSSDFLRARETAERVAERLQITTDILFEPRLRERFFGALDEGPDDAYASVWERDAIDPDHHDQQVESVLQVYRRGVALVSDLESRGQGMDLLLVAHGDVLQILQTAFRGENPANHRGMPHLATAEIRQLGTPAASDS